MEKIPIIEKHEVIETWHPPVVCPGVDEAPAVHADHLADVSDKAKVHDGIFVLLEQFHLHTLLCQVDIFWVNILRLGDNTRAD